MVTLVFDLIDALGVSMLSESTLLDGLVPVAALPLAVTYLVSLGLYLPFLCEQAHERDAALSALNISGAASRLVSMNHLDALTNYFAAARAPLTAGLNASAAAAELAERAHAVVMAEVASSVAYVRGQVIYVLDEDYEDLNKDSTVLLLVLPFCKAASRVASALSPASLVTRLPSSVTRRLAQLPSPAIIAAGLVALFTVPGALAVMFTPLGPAVGFAGCTSVFAFLSCGLASSALAIAGPQGMPTDPVLIAMRDLAIDYASFEVFHCVSCITFVGMIASVVFAKLLHFEGHRASWCDYFVCVLKIAAGSLICVNGSVGPSAHKPAGAMVCVMNFFFSYHFRKVEANAAGPAAPVNLYLCCGARVPMAASLLSLLSPSLKACCSGLRPSPLQLRHRPHLPLRQHTSPSRALSAALSFASQRPRRAATIGAARASPRGSLRNAHAARSRRARCAAAISSRTSRSLPSTATSRPPSHNCKRSDADEGEALALPATRRWRCRRRGRESGGD